MKVSDESQPAIFSASGDAMNALLRPQSIALVGASDTSRDCWAVRLYENLELMNFPVRFYPINPNRTEIWGRTCYPGFAALPEPVDLALTLIPSAAIPATLMEGARHGLRCALVYAAQFGEGDDTEGAARGRALLDLQARFGLRICGPNCMGTLSLRERLLLYPASRIRSVMPGPVGLVFQSGGTFQYWLQQASLRGLGFSYCVSSGIVTFSGNTNGLILDYASEEGATLARFAPSTLERVAPMIDAGLIAGNPLDVGATNIRHPDRYAEICRIVAADPGVDIVAVQGQLPTLPHEDPDPAILRGIGAATQKPVIVFGRLAQNVSAFARDYQQQTGLPFVQGLPAAVRVMQALAKYAEKREQPAPAPPPAGYGKLPSGPALEPLLAAHGLTPPRSAMAQSPAEAAARAAAIGFPVVLKFISLDVAHKTEAGGVALGLADCAAVEAAARAMQADLSARFPQAAFGGFLVQEMVDGLEYIIGARTDPLYGPFLVLGLGGTTVEVLDDTAIALLPVTEREVRAMLASLRSAPLLGEFRGRPPRDVDALVRAVLGLSELFLKHRESLSDIEINPLMVGRNGEGVRAVDVRIVRADLA